MKILQSALTQEKRLVSFRINLLQSSTEEVELALEKASITYTKLDFPKNCYLLDGSFSESHLWKLKIYKQGKIYIQSISSQIPVSFFSHNSLQDTSLNSPLRGEMKQHLRILDACAAPGGKTAQLAEKYPDAEIWAFEPSKVRFEKLLYNLQKQGIQTRGKNSLLDSEEIQETKGGVICIHDAIENIGEYINHNHPLCSKDISPLKKERNIDLQYFDMILVDAPCSSEGSLSLHNTKFLENWDVSHINKNYKRQKRICDSVIPYLKDGGELIYSTCTLAPEENEAVVHYLLCNYPELSLKKIGLQENKYINTKEALKSFGKHPYKKEISEHCQRVIPSEFSEGFFIAKLVKSENNCLK
ncbi:RsmB/NOP family class I SAM-dependent RNA methyltransferase [Candidatus Gracilibacteria bacterium]|nr:RsmB/NOP family class I SAM-dependent RNA methyltransferase [Candidatus Gracilibacteria bacterium]